MASAADDVVIHVFDADRGQQDFVCSQRLPSFEGSQIPTSSPQEGNTFPVSALQHSFSVTLRFRVWVSVNVKVLVVLCEQRPGAIRHVRQSVQIVRLSCGPADTSEFCRGSPCATSVVDVVTDVRLLLDHMKYFEPHLDGVTSADDVDISVHCDVNVFAWLVEYMQDHRKVSTLGRKWRRPDPHRGRVPPNGGP